MLDNYPRIIPDYDPTNDEQEPTPTESDFNIMLFSVVGFTLLMLIIIPMIWCR